MARQELTPLMPGTYGTGGGFAARAVSVQLWDPDAVFVSGTAARLSWWPDLAYDTVRAVAHRSSRRSVSGIEVTAGSVDPDLIYEVAGLRLVHPAWSALELSDEIGGIAIDEALRRRKSSLKAMRWALGLMRNRSGNVARRRLLLESRDEPWSELEREAHVRLRAAKITGWRANDRIVLPSGKVRYADVSFRQERLAVEFDGWEHHKSYESFIDDRVKDVELMCEGWMVARFTAASMTDLVPSITAIRAHRLHFA